MMLSQIEIDEFIERGFLIKRRMFSKTELAPIADAFEASNLLHGKTSSNKDLRGNDSFHAAFWRDPTGTTLLAKLPLMKRIVKSAEALLGTECYYWRSRLVFKKPQEKGRIEDHQDFSFWYDDGCVFPDILSCSIAVTAATKKNGCMEILDGSHKVGRLNLYGSSEGAEYPDPKYIEKISTRHQRIFCELEAGDALFFHGNTIHGSGPNVTDSARVLVHSTYNAAYNEPIRKNNHSEILASSQLYEPIKEISDDMIISGNYSGVFDHDTFFPVETTDKNVVGIFKRPSRSE